MIYFKKLLLLLYYFVIEFKGYLSFIALWCINYKLGFVRNLLPLCDRHNVLYNICLSFFLTIVITAISLFLILVIKEIIRKFFNVLNKVNLL